MACRQGRRSRTGAVLVLTMLVLTVAGAGSAGATDDPSGPPAQALVSGVEGSKAALVRIDVSAIAQIAHIDHSTGDVDVRSGQYEVPVRSGTGVFTSAEGVIATAGATLAVTEDEVVVHAANRLFQEQMGTELVGHDGDLSRRAQAVDPYWAPHLQHCYDQVEHCVLFFVPQYQVIPHTREPTSTPADVLPLPDGPTDVGLLRISGAGGTPTAELAPADQDPPEQGLLTGFAQRPEPAVRPGEMTVDVDTATGTLSSAEDLAAALGAGMDGGPVLDPATGQVAGLATTAGGTPAMVPAARLRAVLEAAGAPITSSEFDTVFRSGIDHLASGHASTSAASSLEESLAYYDSALAAAHYEVASRAAEQEGTGSPAGADDGAGAGGLLAWLAAGVLVVLLLLGAALLLRRRRAGSPDRRAAVPTGPLSGAPGGTLRPGTVRGPEPTSGRPAPMHPAATGPDRSPTGEDPSASRERTRLRGSPALVREPVPRGTSPAFCSDCGAPLRELARFCGSCGSPVS